MADIFHTSGGEIIEQNHAIPAIEKSFRQMRTDKTSAASN